MVLKSSVVPTYLPDPMHHLAVRIPLYSTKPEDAIEGYPGSGPDSDTESEPKAWKDPSDPKDPKDPYDQPKPSREQSRNEKWLEETRTKLQSTHLYLVRRMMTEGISKKKPSAGPVGPVDDPVPSNKVYCFRGLGFSAEGEALEPSELIINRRKRVHRNDEGNCEEIPNELKISTLWDPLSSGGVYLERELPYFPLLMGYTLHKVKQRHHQKLFPTPSEMAGEPLDSSSEEEQDYGDPKELRRTKVRREKDDEGLKVFSMYFEYFNGGTIKSFMEKIITRAVDGKERSGAKIPETLIWHALAEVGSAIIKLQTGEPALVNQANWGCIVHRAINMTNVYLHFNEEDFDSADETKKVEARCFPRVVLNNFSLACVEMPQTFAPGSTFDLNDPPTEAWWDIYCLGLLLRQMVWHNKTRMLGHQLTTDFIYDFRKVTTHHTMANFEAEHTKPRALTTSKVYSTELITLLKMFDLTGWDQTNDAVLSPKNRSRLPDIDALKTVVQTAKQKVAEFKRKTLATLPQDSRWPSDISWAGPLTDRTGNIMLFRPEKSIQKTIWGMLEDDLMGFEGPIEAAKVEYSQDADRVLINGDPVTGKLTENGVIPFRYEHEKPTKDDKKRKKVRFVEDDTDAREAAHWERRKRIRDEWRGDTLLELQNALFFQGMRKPWFVELKRGETRAGLKRVGGEIPFLDRWEERYKYEFYGPKEKDYVEEELAKQAEEARDKDA